MCELLSEPTFEMDWSEVGEDENNIMGSIPKTLDKMFKAPKVNLRDITKDWANLLSTEETNFIKGGFRLGLRSDGRNKLQYREINVEPGLCPSKMGSAKVNLGESEILVTVNGELVQPIPEEPNKGIINFSMGWVPDCGKKLEMFDRRDHFNDIILENVKRVYSCMDLQPLCVISGKKCWKLFVDIFIFRLDGGLYGAISYAIKAALLSLKLPKVVRVDSDAGETSVSVSEHEEDAWTPKFCVPNMHSFIMVEENIVLDPSNAEELCAKCSFMIATHDGKVVNFLKEGSGLFKLKKILTLFNTIHKLSDSIDKQLFNVCSGNTEFV